MIFKYLWPNDWPFFLSVGWNVSPQETEFVPFSSILNVMIFVTLGVKKKEKEKKERKSIHNFWSVSIIFPTYRRHKIPGRIEVHDSLVVETQSHMRYHR